MFVLFESLGRVKQLRREGEVQVLCPNLFGSYVMINNYNLPVKVSRKKKKVNRTISLLHKLQVSFVRLQRKLIFFDLTKLH